MKHLLTSILVVIVACTREPSPSTPTDGGTSSALDAAGVDGTDAAATEVRDASLSDASVDAPDAFVETPDAAEIPDAAIEIPDAAIETFDAALVVIPPDDGDDTVDAGPVVPQEPVGIGRDGWGGLQGSGLATTATGFFHVEKPANAERTWLVDPSGNPYFAVGVNTVLREARVPDVHAYLTRLPSFDDVARIEWDRLSTGAAGGYGYGFNTVGAFSETNDLDATQDNPIVHHAPYGIVLSPAVPSTAPYALRSGGGEILGVDDASATLGDPYNPAYQAYLQAKWTPEVRPSDERLLMYWVGNEIGLFDHPLHLTRGVRDIRRWIWTACPAESSVDTPLCAPHALEQFLKQRHGSIGALNAAWNRSFPSFDAVIAAMPMPGSDSETRRCDGSCERDLQRFMMRFMRRWTEVVTTTIRALDPNHLVSSPRMMVANSDAFCFWGIDGCREHFTDGRTVPLDLADVRYAPFVQLRRDGNAGFDVVSINVYSRPDQRGFDEPWFRDGIHKVVAESGLPVFISEFGIRARIDGWTNGGGAPAFVPVGEPGEMQRTRGAYYQHDLTRFMQFRGILGACFHRWADRYDDEDQMNMGILHRDGSRWAGMDSSIKEFNAGLYGRIRGATGW